MTGIYKRDLRELPGFFHYVRTQQGIRKQLLSPDL
jgi:hypothetical protein